MNVPLPQPGILPSVDDLYLYQVAKRPLVATMVYLVSLIWTTNWSVMKVVFLVNKYSPVIDITLMALGPDSYFAGTLVSETILLVRTYALWGFDRLYLYSATFIVSMMINTCKVFASYTASS
ncbi:hypothetical protein DICSQDRAFT_125406 [Dichomitus squalens LYAD-421 SS1]|uniref:uncharacterized protein n=1 Tax=Dichomitus squalens (strain LYAD-421) TaxID=732165 RepID=UPI00044160C7|nr:uncharacterized protein DICSQDRAFT_125406 [Dichomitus squalens LYAD-421 SS1]EJF63575.1 hypothetical protein DICSQDRAFT_125406 [Dichomitus squalens LYAD-421 SS1]